MKALSIKQPWCDLILNHGKDIENRTWKTNLDKNEQFYIHASKSIDKEAYDKYIKLGFKLAPIHLLKTGGIVGKVTFAKWVTESDSKWYEGEIGFVLKNPVKLQFVPYKGQLKFFTPKL